MVIQIGQPI